MIKNNKRLLRTVGFTILLIMILQIGKSIVLPGFYLAQTTVNEQSPVIHFLSATTGGNLLTPTLFSVGLGPYMTALILWSTISLIDIDLINNLTEAQQGYVMRGMTLIFSFLQSLVLTFSFSGLINRTYYADFSYDGMFAIIVLLLTTGGMIVAWLADMNMQKGVGQQMVLYLPGIIQGILSMLTSGSTTMQGATTFNLSFFIGMIIFTLVFMFITVLIYNAERRIPLQQTGIESKFNDSYIPIRLLNAGVMPFMFTMSLFEIPQLFMSSPSFVNSYWGHIISTIFSIRTVPGVITYGILFFALSMGFSYVNVRPHDLAKNLKESGDYILNIKPGHDTESYITSMMTRVGLIGNTYLVIVSIVPLLIGLKLQWVQNISFYVGSVFFLIVITDTVYQSVKFVRDLNKYTIFE